MKEIFDSKQPQIVYCESGRVFAYLNEREFKAMESSGIEGEQTEVTKYEYDVLKLNPSEQTEEAVLAMVKEMKIRDISDYDESPAVNNFTFNGQKMWLGRELRRDLSDRVERELSLDNDTLPLNYEGQTIVLPLAQAKAMLATLAHYADLCYDNTARHKAAVAELTSLEEVFNYDFTTGYPPQIAL